jgi:hypothetical protein
MRRQAWVAIVVGILVGASVGGAVAVADTSDGDTSDRDIFNGGPLPTRSDPVQANIDAYANEAYGIYTGLGQMSAAGTPECGPQTMCGSEPNSSRLVTLLQRCNRSGFPEDTLLKGQTDKAQALIRAVNSACGRLLAIKAQPPTTDAEWVAFAKLSLPELEDAFKFATGHDFGWTEAAATTPTH